MFIPPQVLARILRVVIKSAPAAFRGATLLRKTDIKRIAGYTIKIVRRGALGTDGGISQMVEIFKGDVKQGVWHIVVKAGKVIHEHLK